MVKPYKGITFKMYLRERGGGGDTCLPVNHRRSELINLLSPVVEFQNQNRIVIFLGTRSLRVTFIIFIFLLHEVVFADAVHL